MAGLKSDAMEAIQFGVAVGAGEETANLLAEIFGIGGIDIGAFTSRASVAARSSLWAQVQAVNVESVQAVRDIIGEGLTAGDTPRVVALRVKQVIGLDTRRAGALAKLERDLRSAGLDEQTLAARLAAAREEKLLSRAYAWSRTGNLEAAMRGQLELWREAQSEGKLSADLGTKFDGASGHLDGPPGHPHCLCAVQMILDERGVFRRVWIRVPLGVPCSICDSYNGQTI